jgi:hypothetical protein
MRVNSCGLRMKYACTWRPAPTEGVKAGVVLMCCIAVFLTQASFRSVVRWQHVSTSPAGQRPHINQKQRVQLGRGFLPPTVSRHDRITWRPGCDGAFHAQSVFMGKGRAST